MAVALEAVTGTHARRWSGTARPSCPTGIDLIALPGGFSYGDYLRSGAMAARSPVMRAVVEAAARGVPVLGVCNGFQVLTEAGLLPGALMRNAGLNFVCRDVALTVENAQSPFTSRYEAGETITHPGRAPRRQLLRRCRDARPARRRRPRRLPLCRATVNGSARAHRRRAQRGRQRARHDAAPRADDRGRARRQRRAAAVRGAAGAGRRLTTARLQCWISKETVGPAL